MNRPKTPQLLMNGRGGATISQPQQHAMNRQRNAAIFQNQFPASTGVHHHQRDHRSVEMVSSDNGVHDRMTLEQSICDDLQMFEQRLEEVLDQLRPRSKRWQVILAVSFLATLFGAFQWLTDPETYEVSCFDSFWNHKFFTANCLILIGLLLCGIHCRIFAPSIIADRVREVIAQFNMSCDDRGKLILMPHPNYFHPVQKNGHR